MKHKEALRKIKVILLPVNTLSKIIYDLYKLILNISFQLVYKTLCFLSKHIYKCH